MIRLQHKSSAQVEGFAKELTTAINQWSQKYSWDCQALGPSEAPISKIKHYYRWQLMVKSPSVNDLLGVLRAVREYVNHRKSPVQVSLDVDPAHGN